MNLNGKSWKTSLGAVGLALSGLTGVIAILTGNAPLNETSLTAILGAFGGAWGLWNAKDKNVTGTGAAATTEVK